MRRELFGGAITMDVPQDFIDASGLRQIPDTQEVYLDPASDISIIVEVLQGVDVEGPEHAIKFHFDSLAYDNSATSQKILKIIQPSGSQVVSIHETPRPIVLHGEQEARKFNRSIADQVRVYLALYRVESKRVDVVLTVNAPLSVEGGNSQPDEKAGQTFNDAASSLTIVDFGLFV
ncbi:Mog1p/PsbP-like protein [Ramaria rubella]|nr:Mog1p/PsbP-like protein [Ramaria rubella]